MQRQLIAGCVAAAAMTLGAPAIAQAQYVAPPPDPGFRYIFNGTTTGSDASFDQWKFASGTLAQSGTRAVATVDSATGAIKVGASQFGSYTYLGKAFGDAVFRVH